MRIATQIFLFASDRWRRLPLGSAALRNKERIRSVLSHAYLITGIA